VISVEQNKISLRQNASMQQLTTLATVFLPLSFVVGFFGQNFQWMVDNLRSETAFLALGVGGLALSLALLLGWMRYNSRHSREQGTPAWSRRTRAIRPCREYATMLLETQRCESGTQVAEGAEALLILSSSCRGSHRPRAPRQRA